MIKVLIVDDEPLARRGVRVCLRSARDVTVVGEAASGPEALEKIASLSPDLVFLDVQMPGMDGFELLARLKPDTIPFIVFLTAHDDYALQAFAVHALDYVMKPIDDARFAVALEAARRRCHDRQAGEQLAHIRDLLEARSTAQAPDHFVVKTGSRTHLLSHADIDWIEAAGDYATLHAGKRSFMIRSTMDALERQLDPASFARIHRSTIVALNRLSGFSLLPTRDALVKLKDGTQLRASRRYRHRLAFR